MGFQFDVMFIDSFMDDVNYERDVEVCVECMICYITGYICYGSREFWIGICMITVLDLLAEIN